MTKNLMTKTEVREWLRRAREDLRDAERALVTNDTEALAAAITDGIGSLGEVEAALNGGNAIGQVGVRMLS